MDAEDNHQMKILTRLKTDLSREVMYFTWRLRSGELLPTSQPSASELLLPHFLNLPSRTCRACTTGYLTWKLVEAPSQEGSSAHKSWLSSRLT